MRRFEMSPNGDYQEKMTESLYNAGWRYDLDYDVLSYLRTHTTNREPRELMEGYLSERHVKQLVSIQNDVQNYSGPHNTRYISSMIEALCVEGGTSQEVNINAEMRTINWDSISGQYRDLSSKSVRTEYARVREIARSNRNNELNIIVKKELIDELEGI